MDMTANSQKATRVRVHAHGGPEVLSLDEVEVGPPGPHEVLVEVKVAGVNFMDTQFRSGLYTRPFPISLGHEGAGVILAVGTDVTNFQVSDRVAWIQVPGTYATHNIVPIQQLAALPDSVSFEAAAATLFQGITAHYLACSTYPLKPNDVCIVHSAAGGMGTLLCQIAKLRGARVIGTVSSEAKSDSARKAGADLVVVYTREDFAKASRDFTSGKGVDVVYDAIGLETYRKSIEALRPRGVLALYGEASGLVPPFDIRLLNAGSLYVTRTGSGSYMRDQEERSWRMKDILAWLAAGSLRQTIHDIFPLSRIGDAHRAIESRAAIGKILVKPGA